mmetsp:Transcript_361/g.1705  ORF Transcript_361/g.1705 Transcript_361/m.1705 type:complete len:218 (+) Transcript_361:336-989(+)
MGPGVPDHPRRGHQGQREHRGLPRRDPPRIRVQHRDVQVPARALRRRAHRRRPAPAGRPLRRTRRPSRSNHQTRDARQDRRANRTDRTGNPRERERQADLLRDPHRARDGQVPAARDGDCGGGMRRRRRARRDEHLHARIHRRGCHNRDRERPLGRTRRDVGAHHPRQVWDRADAQAHVRGAADARGYSPAGRRERVATFRGLVRGRPLDHRVRRRR